MNRQASRLMAAVLLPLMAAACTKNLVLEDGAGEEADGSYTLSITNGVALVGGDEVSAPGFTFNLLEGPSSIYTLAWSVDGREAGSNDKIRIHSERSFRLPSGLPLGEHVFEASLTANDVEGYAPKTIRRSFFVQGPDLEKANVSFTTQLGDYAFGPSRETRLSENESGVLFISYSPKRVGVEVIIRQDGDLVKLDDRAGSSYDPESGTVSIPFSVQAKGSGRMAVSLVNWSDTLTVTGFVNTGEEKILPVADFTLEDGTMGPVRMKIGESRTVKIRTYPEKAMGAEIRAVKSADESTLRASFSPASSALSFTVTADYVGTVPVSVTVGEITREITVEVEGDVVRDIDYPADLDGMKIHCGGFYGCTVRAVPATAFDAGTLKVTSSDESVIRVTRLPEGQYRFEPGERCGSATVTMTAGCISKRVTVRYAEDISSGLTATPRIEWGESVTVTPTGHFSSFTASSDSRAVGLGVSGGTLTVTNRNYTTEVYASDATARVTLTTGDGETSTFEVVLLAVTQKVTLSLVREGSGAKATTWRCRVKNGFGSSVTQSRLEGYLFSESSYEAYLSSGTDMELKSRLSGGAGRDIVVDGKTVARYCNLLDATPVKAGTGGRRVNLEPLSITEMPFTAQADGDSFGKYGDGWSFFCGSVNTKETSYIWLK